MGAAEHVEDRLVAREPEAVRVEAAPLDARVDRGLEARLDGVEVGAGSAARRTSITHSSGTDEAQSPARTTPTL